MTALRRIARPLLASVFIADGVDAVRHPAPYVAGLEASRAQMNLATGGHAPADLTPVVRACGAVSIVAGLMLAAGRAPRPAAFALAVAAAPLAAARNPKPAANTPEARKAYTDVALRQAALLGGLLIAGADTAGKPSIGWRVAKAREAKAAAAREAIAGVKAKVTKD